MLLQMRKVGGVSFLHYLPGKSGPKTVSFAKCVTREPGDPAQKSGGGMWMIILACCISGALNFQKHCINI